MADAWGEVPEELVVWGLGLGWGGVWVFGFLGLGLAWLGLRETASFGVKGFAGRLHDRESIYRIPGLDDSQTQNQSPLRGRNRESSVQKMRS